MVAAAVALSIFEENVPFFDVTVKEGIIFIIALVVVAAALSYVFGFGRFKR